MCMNMDPNHTWEDIAGEFENQRNMYKAQRDMLGQALGEILVHLNVVENVHLTGPQLLVSARAYLEDVHENQSI